MREEVDRFSVPDPKLRSLREKAAAERSLLVPLLGPAGRSLLAPFSDPPGVRFSRRFERRSSSRLSCHPSFGPWLRFELRPLAIRTGLWILRQALLLIRASLVSVAWHHDVSPSVYPTFQ